jgi:hypothetical protein
MERFTANLLLTVLMPPESRHKMLPLPILAVQVPREEVRKGVVSTLHSLRCTATRALSIILMVQQIIHHLT